MVVEIISPCPQDGSPFLSDIPVSKDVKTVFLTENKSCLVPLEVRIPVTVFVVSKTTTRLFSSDNQRTILVLQSRGILNFSPGLLNSLSLLLGNTQV